MFRYLLLILFCLIPLATHAADTREIGRAHV